MPASYRSAPSPAWTAIDARGRARVRSSLLLGGLALGLATGAAATLLFDPDEGRTRRTALRQRMGSVLNDVRRTIDPRRRDSAAREQRLLTAPTGPEWQLPPRSSVAASTDGRKPVAAGVDR